LSTRIWFLFVFCGIFFCGLVASASAQSIFSNLTYSVGGGLGLGRNDVASYAGNSPFAVAGVGKNFTRMFGADVEYMYYDLDFRPSVKEGQHLANESGQMQSISVDGIVNVPRHVFKLGAYGIFGIGFYRRTVSVPKELLAFNTNYEPAYRWWDLNFNLSGQVLQQYISSNSKDAGGFNYGGGITYPLGYLHNSKIFVEYRYHRAYQSDGQTIVSPITIGLRW
jgi:hypothetical protein